MFETPWKFKKKYVTTKSLTLHFCINEFIVNFNLSLHEPAQMVIYDIFATNFIGLWIFQFFFSYIERNIFASQSEKWIFRSIYM